MARCQAATGEHNSLPVFIPQAGQQEEFAEGMQAASEKALLFAILLN